MISTTSWPSKAACRARHSFSRARSRPTVQSSASMTVLPVMKLAHCLLQQGMEEAEGDGSQRSSWLVYMLCRCFIASLSCEFLFASSIYCLSMPQSWWIRPWLTHGDALGALPIMQAPFYDIQRLGYAFGRGWRLCGLYGFWGLDCHEICRLSLMPTERRNSI